MEKTHILFVRVGEEVKMKCERWVFGEEGDGERLRDVDRTEDEV